MARRSAVAILTAVLVLTALHAAEARRGKWTDMPEALLDIARDHRKALEASLPKRARDVKETAASLDRNTTLYARGLVTRDELGAVAREAGEARAQLEWTRQELTRAAALIAEIETRRRLAHRPPLRPGQYEAGDTFIRFAGHRAFAPSQLVPLEQFFTRRAGRRLPVSAHGQSDVHTRLGLDHRNAVDIAVHPDSVEGRLVMAWLREQGYPFMAFRGARQGAATGAHIHVGAPSERLASARVPERRSRGAAPTVVPARTPAAA
ncbi:MAG: hypothetical protein FJ027_22705, partial [Candidatus Rokubacteria bacterium]|nr:hypothetical protein [Candidatus Rokubacteria bacterium]